MNRSMEGKYCKVAPDIVAGTQSLDNRLADLLDAGFVQTRGAYLFRAQEKLAKSAPTTFQDLTGYECFVNHIHIEDYLDCIEGYRDPLIALKQAIIFARRVTEKLKASFPQKPYTIIVASNESGCTVRFHSTRRGERWLSDNLEGYKEEAIMVLEIPPQ